MKKILITIACLLFLLGCSKKEEILKDKLNDIKVLHFSYTTGYHMNASINYELECNEDCILYYKGDGIDYEDRKEYKVEKELLKEIEDKLNEYEVINWNGFNGYTKDVLDGNSFNLSITYDNDKKVNAHGYEMWPENYRKVRDYLDQVFSKYKEDQ